MSIRNNLSTFHTSDTKLAAALLASNTGKFLQIDQERSTFSSVFFIFSPFKACQQFAEDYYNEKINKDPRERIYFDKLLGEVQIFKRSIKSPMYSNEQEGIC